MMSYIIYPIGDSAATIELGTVIDESANRKVIAMQLWLKENGGSAIEEVTIAYSSLSVYYTLISLKEKIANGGSAFQYISTLLQRAYKECLETAETDQLIKIPVCYHPTLGLDLEYISEEKSIAIEEIIACHTSRTYRVFMIGFLPGFPYMAEVDDRIAVPRKPSPRPLVLKGSVGIAGNQTGIYPLDSPGGWQIIGRTPFKLFDPYGPEVVAIQPGDKVRFFPISIDEFNLLNN